MKDHVQGGGEKIRVLKDRLFERYYLKLLILTGCLNDLVVPSHPRRKRSSQDADSHVC